MERRGIHCEAHLSPQKQELKNWRGTVWTLEVWSVNEMCDSVVRTSIGSSACASSGGKSFVLFTTNLALAVSPLGCAALLALPLAQGQPQISLHVTPGMFVLLYLRIWPSLNMCVISSQSLLTYTSWTRYTPFSRLFQALRREFRLELLELGYGRGEK
ncbi:hypothetical protein B0T20DRAFT_416519 [Sordaria brevicollis]|uniref:Uncharacterized protein n=1 Tax=Sordaria brevicollis TaxID=83679 RepID=A0AAE0PAB0_SORBR|nr:hypothetical protein B0T20DRAFT_416519 [Sordaria brevicollis]